MRQIIKLSVLVSLIPTNLKANVQGYWLRKSTMHQMELSLPYKMLLAHMPVLIKTTCLHNYASTGSRSLVTLGTHHAPLKTIRRRINVSTSPLDPATLCMHRWPLSLTYLAMTTINHCGSSHHCQSSRRHLAGHLDLVCNRHNVSTSRLDPATLYMHRRPLPLTCVATAIINRCGSSHYCRSRRRHLVAHLDHMWHPIHTSTTGREPDTMGIYTNALLVTHIPMARTQAVATKDLVTDRLTTITDVNRVLLPPSGVDCCRWLCRTNR